MMTVSPGSGFHIHRAIRPTIHGDLTDDRPGDIGGSVCSWSADTDRVRIPRYAEITNVDVIVSR